jgi:hypothetical protein
VSLVASRGDDINGNGSHDAERGEEHRPSVRRQKCQIEDYHGCKRSATSSSRPQIGIVRAPLLETVRNERGGRTRRDGERDKEGQVRQQFAGCQCEQYDAPYGPPSQCR